MIGGGPAGCAAAILLAREGARVALLERSAYETARIGETLPPEVRLPLQRLGVWDRFLAEGHTASPGVAAAWGQAEPYANDFILNPYGSGWQVDRARFDRMLASAAEAAGAAVRQGAEVVGCFRGEPSGGWELAVAGAADPVSAAFLVDATGRASPLRRILGARRIVHDRLVALVGFAGADEDRRALIEATPHGWWYSAGLPDGRLVLAFHTDARPGLRAEWADHLAGAPHTSARVAGVRATGVRHAAAGTQRLEPAAAGSWLAVGDAAAAHDPISGLGVYWALESGMEAAQAVLAGRPGVAAYARAAEVRFGDYLAQRAMYYRAETRWPDSPFWHRRRQPISASSS